VWLAMCFGFSFLKTRELTVSDSDNEWRSISIRATASKKTRIVIRHKKSGNRERDHVKQQDTPEDLLDGFGELDARIPSFSCCETDEFGSRERESGRDEDATEAFEPIVESAGLVPCASA
jgi:hypothetical protein